MHWFEGFTAQHHSVNGVQIFARAGGNAAKPALLLLHGFPQSHVMWHRVAQLLKDDFFLVMPDLRGYGDSSKPAVSADNALMSKRAMAQDAVDVMAALGHRSFYVCGHDRGGRVAHRLATDHPERVKKLCVMDIAPTLDMYSATDMAFARAYYHWFHLIQPHPLPERMIFNDWKHYLHAKLGGWGSAGVGYIEPEALAHYERCFGQMDTLTSMCEDYRASAGIDLAHDKASRAASTKIACDTLVIWGERGVVNKIFKPIELWQAQCAGHVSGQAVPAGHFIPEELPESTAQSLRQFFA
jgi:haloacetate dehalogenase